MQIQNLFFVFFLLVFMAHLSTCLWIQIGFLDQDKLPEERESWIYVNELYGADSDGEPRTNSNFALYVFTIYWIFTTLTTVGYGDYSGVTTTEYLVTLLFEFFGFCFNAVLISTMTSFF